MGSTTYLVIAGILLFAAASFLFAVSESALFALGKWRARQLTSKPNGVIVDGLLSRPSELLATIVLLFAFQGRQILTQPLIIALLAVPIVIQVYFNSALAYWLNRRLRVAHSVACPSALIGASNFFELAVATAITLFGFNSGAALATVVGVLVEVPVMLSVVAIVNGTRRWYEAANT